MGANEQGKLGEIEWSSRGRGGEEGGEECRYKQLCSIGVHTGISSNSRMPFAILNFPLAPLTDPAFAGYLRAHFDQQESNRSLGLQKNHATKSQQTLPRIRRAGGPQKIL